MRASGRTGRGERARVAARVRDLVAGQTGEDSDPDPQPDRAGSAWLPDGDFDRHVPRHGSRVAQAGGRPRWDPGRRGLAALGAAAVVVAAAVAWWLTGSRPRELPVSSSVPSGAVPASVASAGPLASGTVAPSSVSASLVVDVAGKVRRPGIYTLPAGARIYDALRAAGGPRTGVSTLSLNLAEPLHDGEQVVVGLPAPPGGAAPPAGSGAPASSAGGTVDLNTATLTELEALPGVGPVLGQNILDWRAAHGRFTSVDQLGDVDGIGDKRLAQLRPLVTV